MFASSKHAAFCVVLLWGSSAIASDVAFELAGGDIIVRAPSGEKSIAMGCTPQSFTSLGDKAYALCGRTVLTVDASHDPPIVTKKRYVAPLVSLTVIDGVVSARTAKSVMALDDYEVLALETPVVPPPPTHKPISLRAPEGRTAWGPERQWTPAPTEREPRGVEATANVTTGAGFDGPVGGFLFFDASLAYRSAGALVVAAYGTFGAATGDFDSGNHVTGPRGGDAQVAVGEVLVGGDIRYVAVSGGVGVGLFEHGYLVEPVLALRGRVGERDRITFDWHMSFGIGATFVGEYGGAIEFRIAPTWWLGVDAEVGNLRYGRAMADVRHRIMGTGKHGTLDIRGGVGLAYVETSSANADQPSEPCGAFVGFGGTQTTDTHCVGTNVDYLGPAISFGMLWRP